MYSVYKHTNKINGKIYIGMTRRKPEERYGNNGSNYSTTPVFYEAIQKYGFDSFDHEVVFETESRDEAADKERELIERYNTMDRRYGYNVASGGYTGFKMAEDARIKLSNSMKGNKNGLNKPCSKEKAEKISKAQIGKVISEEAKRKMSEKAKLRHIPCSEEKRMTLRDSYPKMRKIYCEQTGVVYKSVQECGRQLNISASQISAVCRGKHKHAKGYTFRYYDDTLNA